MKLNDKLFHSLKAYGIHSNEEKLAIVKLKLERIFLTGRILRRVDIENLYKSRNNFCPINYTAGRAISLSQHPNSKNLINDNSIYVNGFEDDSWSMYVKEEISLVLSKNLLKDNIINSKDMLCPLELQVRNPIDLKYLKAISIPEDSVTRPFFSEQIDENILSTEEIKYYYKRLNIVLVAMKKYNINVPLINIETGKQYTKNEEYNKYLKKSISK